ncbi:MAG: hypothetical protein GY792_26585, partial [Gammaproteobacteria bacterium]|nr:hypothetical protein [Gammaproteobacteria bacterium]
MKPNGTDHRWNEQRLRQKIEELQGQWELLGKKLSGLEQDRILETRAAERLRMETMVTETQAERQQVEDELNELEPRLDGLSAQLQPGKPKRAAKIDIATVFTYNLRKLIDKFSPALEEYGRPAAFTIGGDYAFLNGCVIERLVREIENTPEKPKVLKREVSINSSDLSYKTGLIANKLQEQYDCRRLVHLVSESPSDMFVIIWFYNIPKKQMGEIAATFWQAVVSQVSSCLQGRQFIVLYANVGGTALTRKPFITLPVRKKFEVAHLVTCFRRVFQSHGFETHVIERYLKCLELHHGFLPGTY